MLTVRDGKSEQHQPGDPEHDQWHERNQAVGKQRYENAGAIIAQGLRSAQANFGSLCAACRYLRGEAIDDAKRQEVRAIPGKRQRNGKIRMESKLKKPLCKSPFRPMGAPFMSSS